MRKISIGILLVLLVSAGLVSCAPAPESPPAEAELKSLQVSISGVTNIFAGKESISTMVTWVISNPNDYEVRLDSFEYELSVSNRMVFGEKIIYVYYIPAAEEIILDRPYVTALASLVGPLMLGEGMPQGQAIP